MWDLELILSDTDGSESGGMSSHPPNGKLSHKSASPCEQTSAQTWKSREERDSGCGLVVVRVDDECEAPTDAYETQL